VLLVLFVLLTVAAIVLGVFVLRGADRDQAASSAGAGAGTVSGWADVLARRTAITGWPAR
jgi:preprotein translocase subunit SecG